MRSVSIVLAVLVGFSLIGTFGCAKKTVTRIETDAVVDLSGRERGASGQRGERECDHDLGRKRNHTCNAQDSSRRH